MAKRFQPNQRDKIKESFSGHIFYKVCREVYNIFLNHTPSIIMSAEDLFADATLELDSILTSGDIDSERCKYLWSDTLRTYRELDGTKVGVTESQAQVAMLFYAVMFGLQSVSHSHYRGTLQRELHTAIHRMWDKDGQRNCAEIEHSLKQKVNVYTKEMLDWMKGYFASEEVNLTKEIETIIHQTKTAAKTKQKAGETKAVKSTSKQRGGKTDSKIVTALEKPKTLKYFKYGDKKVLLKQEERVGILFKMFNDWGWLDSKTSSEDFDSFFKGEPRFCNITWKANATILTILLQELLKKDYIESQTNCSAKSLVENQFQKTPNSDRSRISDEDNERIAITLIILDLKNPLPTKGDFMNDEVDVSEAAWKEVYAGILHSTKGI